MKNSLKNKINKNMKIIIGEKRKGQLKNILKIYKPMEKGKNKNNIVGFSI